MKNYNYMDSVVDEICYSMLSSPDRWEVNVYTVLDKKSRNELWHGHDDKPITKYWTGRTTEEVFSESQGIRIRQAFDKMREINSSLNQQKLISTFNEKEVKTKRWWEFWK